MATEIDQVSNVLLYDKEDVIGAFTVEQILDEHVFDNGFPEEYSKVAELSKKSAETLRLLEQKYNLIGTVAVSVNTEINGIPVYPTLVEMFSNKGGGESVDIPVHTTIHILSLFGANQIEAVNCLKKMGGVAEDDYTIVFRSIVGIKLCKKNQKLFEFLRTRVDGREDITRAVFIAEPVPGMSIYDCVATYDLGRDRFVAVADSGKVFKSTKEAKIYAKNYRRPTRIKQGDKEA